jgi:hypothetical protein
VPRRPINLPYRITNTFGVPDSNAKFGRHAGIDYGIPTGREVYAPVSGKVVYARYHSTGGNMVVIFDGKHYHRLMHNSAFRVSVGEQVSEGQLVALSGTTGLSTGPHVHWDINTQGIFPTSFSAFVDPAIVLTGGDVMNKQEVDWGFLLGWNRNATQQELTYWTGKRWEELGKAIYHDGSNDLFRRKAVNYDQDIAAKNKEIEALRKQQAVNRDTVLGYVQTNLK